MSFISESYGITMASVLADPAKFYLSALLFNNICTAKTTLYKNLQFSKVNYSMTSSSFELFVLSIMQEDVHTLRVCAHARFSRLQLDRATTTARLLGPTTCLPHENRGSPLSAFPKDTTSKLTGLFSTLSLLC